MKIYDSTKCYNYTLTVDGVETTFNTTKMINYANTIRNYKEQRNAKSVFIKLNYTFYNTTDTGCYFARR